MKLEDLVEGQEFYGVLGQLVRDHDGKRKRVITTEGQVIPAGIYIECSKAVREANELGTIFKIKGIRIKWLTIPSDPPKP